MSLIVISVGTSLLSNNIQEIETTESVISWLDECNRLESKKKAGVLGDIKDARFNWGESRELLSVEPESLVKRHAPLRDFFRSFFRKYLDEATVAENIRHRSARERDALSAEISSLFLYYYAPLHGPEPLRLRSDLGGDEAGAHAAGASDAPKDTVVLLATETADAVLCAVMVREMIRRLPLFSNHCHCDVIDVIPGLDHYNPSSFCQNSESNGSGLNNLNQYFYKISQDSNKRVLIRTGGYKEFSSYLMLMALNYR